jgi:hypothetical protein
VSDATDVLFDINGYFALPSQSGLVFYPLPTPCRVADTRAVAGFPAPFGATPPMNAGVTRTFPVLSSACGSSIPSSVAAYSLNFTVVTKGYLGLLSTWPTGKARPNVSTLNYYGNGVEAISNAAIVPAGTNGAIDLYVSDPTDVLFDINGYFAPPSSSAGGLSFYPLPPCRVADTRALAGFYPPFGQAMLFPGFQRTYDLPTSSCGIPSAGAYSLNFTAIPVAALGAYIVWPDGQSRPNASTMNSYSGSIVSNAAIVAAGSTGAIAIYVTDWTESLFDINGYFAQ